MKKNNYFEQLYKFLQVHIAMIRSRPEEAGRGLKKLVKHIRGEE